MPETWKVPDLGRSVVEGNLFGQEPHEVGVWVTRWQVCAFNCTKCEEAWRMPDMLLAEGNVMKHSMSFVKSFAAVVICLFLYSCNQFLSCMCLLSDKSWGPSQLRTMSKHIIAYSLDLLVNKNYPTKKRDVCDFCKNYNVICGIDITPKKVQSTICYQEEQWLCKEEVLFSRGFSWTVETLQRDSAMLWPGEWRDLSTRHCLPWIQDSFAAGRSRFQPRNPLKVRVSSCSWRETTSHMY
jgi:hypothetical protein